MPALAGVYAILARTPAVGAFHDEGVYLVTAKALAERGEYRIISLPAEPPQTMDPPLFPWLLSVVWRAAPSFPANVPWLRSVPLTASLAWLWLSWMLLRRLGAARAEAAVIVLLTAASPWTAFLSTSLLSQSLFAMLLTAALLMMTRLHRGDHTRGAPLICGALMGAAVLTRATGVAPAAVGLAWLLISRRGSAALKYGGAVLAITAPWLLWVQWQSAASTAESYYSADASSNIVTSYAWTEKMTVLGLNLISTGRALEQTSGLNIAHPAGVLAVAAVGLVLMTRGLWHARREPAAALTAAYAAFHLAWVWPPLRFLIPVVPLLLWFAYLGTGRSRLVGAAIAVALLCAGGVNLSRLVTQARERAISFPVPRAEDWNQVAQLLDWVAREAPRDAVLTGNMDPAYYLFTGRKAVRAFAADPFLLQYNVAGTDGNPLGTESDFRNRLVNTRADYLIMTPRFLEVGHLRQLVSKLVESDNGALTPVAGSIASGHVIYRIDRRRLDTSGVAAR